jgi:hypothetical protein
MKINGIKIRARDIHPAIIAKVADEALRKGTIPFQEFNKKNGTSWQGPCLLPRMIKDIMITPQGVSFMVIKANRYSKCLSLSDSVIEELRKDEWIK